MSFFDGTSKPPVNLAAMSHDPDIHRLLLIIDEVCNR